MDAGRPAELTLERVEEQVALAFHGCTTFFDVLPEVVFEVLRGDQLAQLARATVRLPWHEPGRDGFGRNEEAEAYARSKDLRERADVHHLAGFREGVNGKLSQRLVADVAVGVVLDDRQAILTGQLQQASPSIARQGRTRGILIARGGVDERRPFADPVLALENVGQRVHTHAMLIEWHADELQPELLEHADRAAVLEFFENDAVARARESLGAERQSLHRAVGDDHVFERWTQAVIALESFGGD